LPPEFNANKLVWGAGANAVNSLYWHHQFSALLFLPPERSLNPGKFFAPQDTVASRLEHSKIILRLQDGRRLLLRLVAASGSFRLLVARATRQHALLGPAASPHVLFVHPHVRSGPFGWKKKIKKKKKLGGHNLSVFNWQSKNFRPERVGKRV